MTAQDAVFRVLPFPRRWPQPRRIHESQPVAGVRGVTVCIAAASRELQRIFLVADMKLSGAIRLDDATSKIRRLTEDGRWWCLVACDDFPNFESIYLGLVNALPSQTIGLDMGAIIGAAELAYRDELRRLARLRVLMPFSPDVDAFETGGLALFGDKTFNEMRAEIAKLTTGVHLLVAGFDSHGVPHVLFINDRGESSSYDSLGFMAIGEGWRPAMDSLQMSDDFRRSTDRGLIVYRLCEAKFAAESTVESVGSATMIVTVESNGTTTTLVSDSLARARKRWDMQRKKRPPKKLLLSLSGGMTFDSSGEFLADAIEHKHHLLSASFDKLMLSIETLTAGRRFSTEQQQHIKVISDRVERYSQKILDALKQWDDSNVQPLGLDNLMKWYEDTISQLETMIQAASA